mgnify:FL=1|jgi:putative addiction module component (TIGR02574 family)
MNTVEVLNEAINLKSKERFILVEGILKSLDKPDHELDKIWADEAQRRLNAYRDGRLKGIPMEEVLKQKPANIAKAFDILSQLNSSDGFFEEKRVDDIPQERE